MLLSDFAEYSLLNSSELSTERQKKAVLELQLNILQVEIHALDALTFVHQELDKYTSHGADHSWGIIDNLHDFLLKWNLKISPQEAYLLYYCAWFHDIGNLIDRENHHIESCKIIERIPDYLRLAGKNGNWLPQIQTIIKYHRSKTEFGEISEDIQFNKIKLLAAIFRLMDGIDIRSTRCPEIVYNIIKERLELNEVSNNKWIAHQLINTFVWNYNTLNIYLKKSDHCQFENYKDFFDKIIGKEMNEDILKINRVFNEFNLPDINLNIVETIQPSV